MKRDTSRCTRSYLNGFPIRTFWVHYGGNLIIGRNLQELGLELVVGSNVYNVLVVFESQLL